MKKLLVSLLDLKANSWSFPAQADNKACALRMFADLVSDRRTLVGQHPEDFDLYVVGFFDSLSGSVLSSHDLLGNGKEFVRDVSHQV